MVCFQSGGGGEEEGGGVAAAAVAASCHPEVYQTMEVALVGKIHV